MRFLRRFLDAKDGAVAVILALSLLPIILLGGAAVDLRRVSAARTNLQGVADSAALAGADALRRNADPQGVRTVATNYVNGALAGANPGPTTAVDVRGSIITVTVNMRVPMTLMRMARFNDVGISAVSAATFGAGGPVVDSAAEIVLVLDTTGSMSIDGRLDAAKTAAKTLVDMVMKKPDGSLDPRVRVGLVPFAQYVNVGLQYRNESWLSNTRDYTLPAGQSCGTRYQTWDPGPIRRIEQTCWYPNEQSYDCSYDQQTWTNPRDPVEVCSDYPAKTSNWRGCVGSVPLAYFQGANLPYYQYDENVEVTSGGRYTPPPTSGIMDIECSNPLVRLTASIGELNSAIDALTPSGFTYIAPGALWGWRLLTRGQPFDDASRAGAAVKSLVLMTDGANTRSPYYPDHSWTSVQTANDKTLKVCANAKAAGIRIYTIGFALGNTPGIRDLLRACASAPTNYYDAPSAPDLQRAFSDIGNRMVALRLVR